MYSIALSLAITFVSCNRDGNNSSDTTITTNDYTLSEDKTILLTWKNKSLTNLDMNSHPILKDIIHIGKEAFQGNTTLKSITLSDKITIIEDNAFKNTSITSITLPKNLNIMGYDVFANSQLSSVTITEGISQIAAGAFRNTKNLKEITLPSSITDIHDEAFIGSGLETLIMKPIKAPNLGEFVFPSTIKRILVPNEESAMSYRIAKGWSIYHSIIRSK